MSHNTVFVAYLITKYVPQIGPAILRASSTTEFSVSSAEVRRTWSLITGDGTKVKTLPGTNRSIPVPCFGDNTRALPEGCHYIHMFNRVAVLLRSAETNEFISDVDAVKYQLCF